MRRLFLTLSVLLMAIIFIVTSFVVSTEPNGQFIATEGKVYADTTPSAQGNSIFSADHIKYTLPSTHGNPFTGSSAICRNNGTNNILNANMPKSSKNACRLGSETPSSSNGIKVLYSINVGIHPSGVAFDSFNGNIYVANEASCNVSVINGTTNKVIQSITTGKSPSAVVADNFNGYVYVLNFGACTVSVINPNTNKVIDNITLNSNPVGAVFDSFNGNIYVGECSPCVSVINSTTNKVVQNITVGKEPRIPAFDSFNGNIYVPNECSGNVSVINGTTDKVIDSIPAGKEPFGATFNNFNGNIYVANYLSDNVTVINGTTNKVVQNVPIGKGPYGATFDTFNGNVYIPDECSTNVSVIDGETNKVIQNITVGKSPISAAFDSLNGNIYVANIYSNNVSVLGYSTYSTTFTETGLPSGTTWYANVTNSIGHIFHGSSTTSIITFNLVNGTYSFTNSTGDKSYAPSSYGGSFTVSGSAVNLPTVVFSSASKVTFKETGLPSGTIWYANVTNNAGYVFHGSSSTNIITFNLINGIYSFTNSTGDKSYAPSSPAGTFAVAGSAMTLPAVVFSLVTYKVTFKETGLPSGSDWYVNITGHDSGAITGSNYSVNLTNGTYAYTIGTNNANFYANGNTVVINGQSKTVSVTFTAYSQPSKPSNSGISGIELYSIIGVVVAVVVVGSAIFMMRRKK